MAVQHQPAGRADVRAHAQAFLHPRPAVATVLAGIVWRDRDHLTASVHCFALKDGAKRAPARITDALAEAVVPYHVRYPQVFEIDGVVLSQEPQCRFVMEVRALSLHLLMF